MGETKRKRGENRLEKNDRRGMGKGEEDREKREGQIEIKNRNKGNAEWGERRN
jgi:hypothetical protein